MHSLKLALVAFAATLATAQTSTGACATITINAAADATNIPCRTVDTIIINNGVTGAIDIEGPTTISSDLVVQNVTQLVSLTSTSVSSIGGTFTLQGLTLLSTLSFTSLTSVNEISWITLPALSTLTFGTVGVTKVNTIRISDTFLSSLDGLNVATTDSFSIDNNKQLVTYTSSLKSVSSLLSITANGRDLAISAPDLVWVKELEVQDVGSINLSALQVVNASMKFDKNDFTTFSAPNMTSTGSDFSFINNAALTNITLPLLTKTGGAFTIQNNTALTTINGFPNLSSVGGAVILRGNMTDIELPSLNAVKGAFTVISTADITSSCATFNPNRPSSQGGNDHFQGTYTCKGNVATANSGGNSTSGGSGNNTGSFAAHNQLSMPVFLGFAALGAAAQIL